jgi:DNA-binding NtrC family response regulator
MDRSVAEREFVIQSLLALRAEVAALRELIVSRETGARAPVSSPYGSVYSPGDAVYPAGPVRVEDAAGGDSLSLKEVERRTIERALRESGGNRRLAAQVLGMSERTLYRRIHEFGIGEPATEGTPD